MRACRCDHDPPEEVTYSFAIAKAQRATDREGQWPVFCLSPFVETSRRTIVGLAGAPWRVASREPGRAAWMVGAGRRAIPHGAGLHALQLPVTGRWIGSPRRVSRALRVGRTFLSAAPSYPARQVPTTRSLPQSASAAVSATFCRNFRNALSLMFCFCPDLCSSRLPWPAFSGPFFAPRRGGGERESIANQRALQRRFSNRVQRV
jgi:hypothetical protein